MAPVQTYSLMLVILAGCSSESMERECSANTDCLQANVPGQCLPSPSSQSQWCAFDNSSCASGLSWGVLTGDGLAGECVVLDLDAGMLPDAGAVDASVADAAGIDARLPPGWGAPSKLPNVNTDEHDFDPAVSSDELEIYFVVELTGPYHGRMHVARRPSVSVPFGSPEEVVFAGAVVNGASSPFVTADGLELWFTQPGDGGTELHVASRPHTSSGWGVPVNVEISGEAPSLTEDKLELYFLRRVADSGKLLYRSNRASAGAVWSDPELVVLPSELYAAGATYSYAHVSADGLGLLLSEPEPRPSPSITGVQLWRSSRSAVWEGVTHQTISFDDGDSWVGGSRWNHESTKIYTCSWISSNNTDLFVLESTH